ncbi:MAG: HNH nuclease family protein [Deltaproteobacteria bacterium]|nr:HNH nuclease family protein [Deltaproteobacteria bacterium]
MALKGSGPRRPRGVKIGQQEIDSIVAKARRAEEERMKGYREQSLRIHPWVCARCGREFTLQNLHLLTVHHKDHNHENNPPDGRNWENLCIYCHDNEHSRLLDYEAGGGAEAGDKEEKSITHRPFAGLANLLKRDR